MAKLLNNQKSISSGIGMGGSSGDTSMSAMLGYGTSTSNPSMSSISSAPAFSVNLGARYSTPDSTQQDALIKGRSSTMLTGGTGLSGGLGSTSKKLLGN